MHRIHAESSKSIVFPFRKYTSAFLLAGRQNGSDASTESNKTGSQHQTVTIKPENSKKTSPSDICSQKR